MATPRTIAPDSFSVAPELLGKPLASPSRRATAMLVDLILLAILIRIGGGAFLGLAAAFVLLRAANRFGTDRLLPRWTRTSARVFAAVLIFIAAIQIWQGATNRESDDEPQAVEGNGDQEVSFSTGDLNLGIGEGIALTRLAVGLRAEEDAAAARQTADSIVRMLKRSGADADQMEGMRHAAHEFANSDENDLARAAIDSAFGAPIRAGESHPDSLVVQLASAIQHGDSIRADSLRAGLRTVLAGPELRELRATIARKEKELSEVKDRVEQLEGNTMRSAVAGVFDDLGLGFGWFAVYFTGFLVVLRGQTPGKKLVGIRVVRLDAKPITWWIAFERFGGYAASFTLGLLGFIQILWDRNRQGLHDKAIETVVIRLADTR
ncbi:MAG: RDD family protein [Gemmatimonadota bacterium]